MVKPPGYRVLHIWVERRLGKPSLCIECGTTEAKVFDWANISGEYRRDLSDWQRMCRSCHRKFDLPNRVKPEPRTHCRRGIHEWVPENIYSHPTRGDLCRACKVAWGQLNRKNYYGRYDRTKLKLGGLK